MILGIDVGSTNIDAVLVDNGKIICSRKLPCGFSISDSLGIIIRQFSDFITRIKSVHIATTHGLNALIQCENLYKVGVLRLTGQDIHTFPPGIGWPDQLRSQVIGPAISLDGGHYFNGKSLCAFDPSPALRKIESIIKYGCEAIAVTGAFACLYPWQEKELEQMITQYFPGTPLSVSSDFGGIGIIERENAAILNCALYKAFRICFQKISNDFKAAGLDCPIQWVQNDGTLIAGEDALRFPLKTISAGPVNSLLGGSMLSGLEDCTVIDVGGTSTEGGVVRRAGVSLRKSLNVLAGAPVGIIGCNVRSFALGGGTIITDGHITHRSVGARYWQPSRPMTLTDAAVSLGYIPGLPHAYKVPQEQAQSYLNQAYEKIKEFSQKLNLNKDLPCVLVGGGSMLWESTPGFIRPPHGIYANAYGAALANIGYTCDQVIDLSCGEGANLAEMETLACQGAKNNGAVNPSVITTDIMPYHYLPGNYARVIIRAAGQPAYS